MNEKFLAAIRSVLSGLSEFVPEGQLVHFSMGDDELRVEVDIPMPPKVSKREDFSAEE